MNTDEKLRRWSEGMRWAAAENLSGLAPQEDLEPVLLLGTDEPDSSPADLIITPLGSVMNSEDWESFKTVTLPSLIVERKAALAAVVTMGFRREPPSEEKTECVCVVAGIKDGPVETHVAKVTRGDSVPPSLGEWESNFNDEGAIAAALALGFAAQGVTPQNGL